MAIFTAIATAITGWAAAAGATAAWAAAIGWAATAVLAVGVSSLITKRMMGDATSGGPSGGRVQLPPATDNKLPVIYGSAYVSGPIIDAKISTDQEFMWYVIALAEVSDDQGGGGGTMSFDLNNIYYDGKRAVVSATDGNVSSLINNTTPPQYDNKINGNLNIYLFTNGSNSGVNTNNQTAIQILNDARIPVAARWPSTSTMNNTAFAIVRIKYNQDAYTTALGAVQFRVTNTITRPGDAILDYLLNDRYGCAVPLSRIDTASLTALNAYSDEQIDYGTGTQNRYRLNGPTATGRDCLSNLQFMVDSCDSWLQYSELSAKWSVIINQSYTDYTTIDDLFVVDSSNLVGGLNIAPINLNDTFNEIEVEYPNSYIRDQSDYQLIQLEDYAEVIMSPNEPVNKLNIAFPQINNSVQALYVGVRRLLQSREDLTVSFQLDYSGIQVDAGDVIRIKQEVYGWDTLNSGYGKLFRVSTVSEEKYPDGSLGVRVTGFEYNDTIYADRALLDFVPDPNTGLSDPNIINTPIAPTTTIIQEASLSAIRVTGTVPTEGNVLFLDFNFGTDPDSATHKLYKPVSLSSGSPYVAGDTVDIEINDLPIGDYYFSIVAKNNQVGVKSPSSTIVNWLGTSLTPATEVGIPNMTSTGTLFETDAGNAFSGVFAGGNVFLGAGVGQLAANTYITSIANSTAFTVSAVPIVALNQTDVLVNMNGIDGNAIITDTLPGDRIIPGTANGNIIISDTLDGNSIIANTLSGNTIIANTINGNTIIANTLNGNTITANTLNGNTIIANTINGNTIIANTINGNTFIANTLNGNTIIANTLSGNSIIANTLSGNSITANTLNGNTIIANTINGNTFIANTINGDSIIANTLNGNAITANTLNGNTIIANSVNGGVIIGNTIFGNAIIANTLDGNAITFNTLNGNSIIANTINGNSIIANTINGNTIIGNTINGNTIIANTMDANRITALTITSDRLQANSIVAGKIAANAVTAGTVQANVITTAELVIGAVTQARSTTAPVVYEQVPFYNWPGAGTPTWPDNTRAIYPAGGASIIPTTDPEGSANIEYTEGSRITVGVTCQLYSATDPNYNIIEVWKSGASTFFDRGFNVMNHSYFRSSSYTGTQTIHAYGYGGIDLYSDDGGATWSAPPFSPISGTTQTFSGAVNTYNGAGTAVTNYYADNFGPIQYYPGTGGDPAVASACFGEQQGATTAQPYSQLRLNKEFDVFNVGDTNYSFTNACFAPDTNGPGKARTNDYYSYFATTQAGLILFSTIGQSLNWDGYEEASGTLQPLNSVFANDISGTSQYTVCAVGGTGTIVRSSRDFTTYNASSPPAWVSKPTTLVNGDTVLTDLYDVAGDGSTQSTSSVWVAVGQFGMIQVSTDDGDSWTQVESPTAVALNGIRYGNGKWIACGNDGVILVNSGDPTDSADWTQVQSTLTDRNLINIDWSSVHNTFNIGGQAIILNSADSTINFSIVSTQAPTETYDLTRLTFFGSHPLVNDVTEPETQARIPNGQVFSTTVVDTQYVEGQETTYFLVPGNLNGAQIEVGQAFLLVQELKR